MTNTLVTFWKCRKGCTMPVIGWGLRRSFGDSATGFTLYSTEEDVCSPQSRKRRDAAFCFADGRTARNSGMERIPWCGPFKIMRADHIPEFLPICPVMWSPRLARVLVFTYQLIWLGTIVALCPCFLTGYVIGRCVCSISPAPAVSVLPESTQKTPTTMVLGWKKLSSQFEKFLLVKKTSQYWLLIS